MLRVRMLNFIFCCFLWFFQENYPGEYINLTVFNSDIPSQPSPERPQALPLIEAPPPNPPDVPDAPAERTLNVTCTFQLSNITAEFPMVYMNYIYMYMHMYNTHCVLYIIHIDYTYSWIYVMYGG